MLDILTLAKTLDASKLSTYEVIIGAVLILASLLIIFVVLLQEGRQANVGVISGAADSFMDKGAAKSLDQKLAKWTKVIAIVFFLLVLGGMLICKFFSNQSILIRQSNRTEAPAAVVESSTSSSSTGSTTASTDASASGTDASASGTDASASSTDATTTTVAAQ